MAVVHQFCTFYVGDLFFGVEVYKVQEVLKQQEMTAVPLAANVIGGLINLRGQIVTAIDLRRRLGLSDRGTEESAMNVVLHSEDGAVSLLVDEIGDVVEVSEDLFEVPPDTMKSEGRDLVRGVYKMRNKLLLLLDIDKATDTAAHSKARA